MTPASETTRTVVTGEPAPAAKLAGLRTLLAASGQAVEQVQTHMSWVFLCGERAYKLKKPVRYDFLDFSTLAAREFNCREEVRLNRRLAPGVYLGVLPLLVHEDGTLGLGPLDADGGATPHAAVVDWLVLMQRLPAARMLDRALRDDAVAAADIDRLAERLAGFYRAAPRVALEGDQYVARQRSALAAARAVLLAPRFAELRAGVVIDRLARALQAHGALLAARAEAGRICDGHGDLRPEHIALDGVPVVIDCLEFNAALRAVDPFDELAFLGMECELLGARWIGPRLVERCGELLGDRPPPAVLALYRAGRALLRARLAAAHLLEADVRTPARWLPQAARYLAQADAALGVLH